MYKRQPFSLLSEEVKKVGKYKDWEAMVSIDADGITDTHLQYNTGQHLTTTSAPIFSGLTVNGTINVGNNGNGGSIQVQGTHDLSLHSVKHISFDWDANYDSYAYHGISSRDGSGNFSDDLTIASFDDIHIRVDSNNNDGPAFMNMYNNTHNSATIFGKWGYDGTNHILYHSGRVGIGSESPAHALDVNGVASSCVAPVPVSSTSLISSCSDFTSGPSGWPYVLTATTIADGAISQGSQTFTMNVTTLPAGGANVRVYKLSLIHI